MNTNGYKLPKWKREEQYEKALTDYLGRDEFKFDVNEDALYSQLKDVYASQAKLAAEDATARATALTGGYGSTYAATAGSQAYNEHMKGLEDAIPDLYSAALDRYTAKGDQMLSDISLLASDYNKYLNDLGIEQSAQGVVEGDSAGNKDVVDLKDPGASFDEDAYYRHLEENGGRSYAKQIFSDFANSFVKEGYTEEDMISMLKDLYAESYINADEYSQLMGYIKKYYANESETG